MVMAEAAFKWLRLSSPAPKASSLFSPSAIVDKRRTDGRLPCQLQHLLCPVDGVCMLLDSLFTDRHCPTAPSGIIARITAAHKKHQSISNRNAVTLIPSPSAAPHRQPPPPHRHLGLSSTALFMAGWMGVGTATEVSIYRAQSGLTCKCNQKKKKKSSRGVEEVLPVKLISIERRMVGFVDCRWCSDRRQFQGSSLLKRCNWVGFHFIPSTMSPNAIHPVSPYAGCDSLWRSWMMWQ